MNDCPFVLWLMGPTSSGKTTIAEALMARLRKDGVHPLHYDGDEVRDFFDGLIDFRPEHRLRVVETIVYLANKGYDCGLPVIVSALTAHEDARIIMYEQVRGLVVAHVNCSIDECARRDPKGLYEKAKNGEIDTLIGYNTPYTAPDSPALTLNTDEMSVDECVETVMTYLKQTMCAD